MNTKLLPVLAMVLAAAGAATAQDAAPALEAPSADTAQAALRDSPRHGEWVDVPFADGQAPLKTWVVYPERADKAPVVIVIHEIFGLTDWIRSVADAMAAQGFVALAPDLLSGLGPAGGGTDSLGDDARTVIRKLTVEDQARRLDAVRQYALKLPAATGRTGVVGFCWGGSATFDYATHQPALNAAVVYYGTAPTEASKLAAIACPVLGFYGGDDARVTSTVPDTAAAMAKAGRNFERHTFDGAGHGFLRQQSGREGANLKAAQAAWKRTVEFFRQTLEE